MGKFYTDIIPTLKKLQNKKRGTDFATLHNYILEIELAISLASIPKKYLDISTSFKTL